MSKHVERVVIIDTCPPTPTYHAMGEVRWDAEAKVTQGFTACGVPLPPYPWWTGCLRREHAHLFARECGRCYREAP